MANNKKNTTKTKTNNKNKIENAKPKVKVSTNKKTTNKKKITQKKKKVDAIEVLRNLRHSKRNIYITLFAILMFAILLITSTYAWFSTTLNVKIRTFNMVVVRNEGLSISDNGIDFGSYLDISQQRLYYDLGETYPNNLTMWPSNGLVPVSTNGPRNKNTAIFDVYTTNGVLYPNLWDRTEGRVRTKLYAQDKPKKYSYFLAFDVFFKNDSGSPVADNLYFDLGTGIIPPEDITEQMQGLVNSVRFAIVKLGSLPMDATPEEIQNIQCNNDCEAIIYEPFSTNHTEMSINNAKKYNIDLVDGETFPTYANVKEVNNMSLFNTISGSSTLDHESFKLQKTIYEEDFNEPLFEIPDGYTKARIYVWIEGQDIDSIETHSEGTDLDLTINFIKDTQGYRVFDEE